MITIVYNITKDFQSLTYKSIESIRQFYRCEQEIQFIITGDVPNKTDGNVQYINFYDEQIPLMHQRMMLPEYLDGIDRLIYLDSDTIAFTCISKLWSVDLQNNIIAASQHAELETLSAAASLYDLEINVEDFKTEKFFNAGVMLIDCKLWRKNSITRACLAMAERHKDKPYYRRNEPYLNCILNKLWLELDLKWNYRPQTKYNRCYIQHAYGYKSHEKPIHFEF